MARARAGKFPEGALSAPTPFIALRAPLRVRSSRSLSSPFGDSCTTAHPTTAHPTTDNLMIHRTPPAPRGITRIRNWFIRNPFTQSRHRSGTVAPTVATDDRQLQPSAVTPTDAAAPARDTTAATLPATQHHTTLHGHPSRASGRHTVTPLRTTAATGARSKAPSRPPPLRSTHHHYGQHTRQARRPLMCVPSCRGA